jgi:hypothetical protein
VTQKKKQAATACFVKPLSAEKEKRKKHTHRCTQRVGVVIDHRLNCLLSLKCVAVAVTVLQQC